MWTNFTILALVTLQRLVELYIARRNTKRLLANGGIEVSSGHYPLIVLFHAVWLGGLWYLVWGEVVSWPLALAYLVLQAARGWIIAALGSRWTTRIIVVPGETLSVAGPLQIFPPSQLHDRGGGNFHPAAGLSHVVVCHHLRLHQPGPALLADQGRRARAEAVAGRSSVAG